MPGWIWVLRNQPGRVIWVLRYISASCLASSHCISFSGIALTTAFPAILASRPQCKGQSWIFFGLESAPSGLGPWTVDHGPWAWLVFLHFGVVVILVRAHAEGLPHKHSYFSKHSSRSGTGKGQSLKHICTNHSPSILGFETNKTWAIMSGESSSPVELLSCFKFPRHPKTFFTFSWLEFSLNLQLARFFAVESHGIPQGPSLNTYKSWSFVGWFCIPPLLWISIVGIFVGWNPIEFPPIQRVCLKIAYPKYIG